MEINSADVAELVDARDLKSPGATEIAHLSDLTRAGNPHEAGGDPAVLSNTPPPLRAGGLDCAPWRRQLPRRSWILLCVCPASCLLIAGYRVGGGLGHDEEWIRSVARQHRNHWMTVARHRRRFRFGRHSCAISRGDGGRGSEGGFDRFRSRTHSTRFLRLVEGGIPRLASIV
jgi:hypothetical protein